MTTTRQQDLIDAIVSDHREAESVFAEIEASGDPRTRRELADHEIEEHAEAEEVMKAIENTEAGDPKFDELLAKLIADIRHHLQDEEKDLLPKLRAAYEAGELREPGQKFERAKKMAPTRPHPSAPDRPPGNKILGPGVGLIDRVRDALSGRDS